MKRPTKKHLLPGLALCGPLLASPALADDVEAAKQLLAEVSRAYSEIPALTDEMELTFSAKDMPEQKVTTTVRLADKAIEAKAVAMMLDVYVIDGTLYATMADAPKSAVKTELGEEPLAVAKKSLDMAFAYLPHHFGLRWTKGGEGAQEFFGMGMLMAPRVAGHSMVDGKDGARLQEILLEGSSGGTSRIHVDPKSKLIHKIVTTGNMEGMDVTFTIDCKPKAREALATAIAFDTEGVELHESFEAMMTASMGDMSNIQPGIEVGTAAPEFELVDQSGKTHSLADYSGKVVLMDWWGIW